MYGVVGSPSNQFQAYSTCFVSMKCYERTHKYAYRLKPTVQVGAKEIVESHGNTVN